MSPFVNHDHEHRWQCLGVNDSDEGWTVLYECRDCSAWSYRTLDAPCRVPFREGVVAALVDEDERQSMIAEQPLARVDGRYVPAAEHPDAPVVVQEGELYHVDAVDEEGSR